MAGCDWLAVIALVGFQLQRSGVDAGGAPQGCLCLEAASHCGPLVASLHAHHAEIAAFPAVGHGDIPENEAGSVNIEPNYANEFTQAMQPQRWDLIGESWPRL